MKLLRYGLITKLCGLLAVALSAPQAVSAEPTPIKIGWTGPLTGNCAVVGVDSAAAIQIAIDQANKNGGVNGRPLELIVEDDSYETTKAVTAFHKLVSIDKVPAIFSSTYGGVFATANEALKAGVLVIDTLDCNDDIAALPENTLCLATRTETIAEGFANHIIRQHYKSALILLEESDGWMQLIARNLHQRLKQSGIQVIEESSLPTAADYKQSLLKGKAARVDAVIFLGNDQMGLAPRQARELGIPSQFYGVGSILSPGFQALAGNSIENALVSSWQAPNNPKAEVFFRKFAGRYGRKPYLDLASLPAYDAAQILINCLKVSSSKQGKPLVAKLRACFLSTRNYSGISGELSFDADGAVRSIHERLFRVRANKLVGNSE